MKIQIVVFGKSAKKFFAQSEDFYQERIRPFAKLEYLVLPEEKISKTIHGEVLKDREAEKFFKVYNERNLLVACDVLGKNLSSEKFSELMQKSQVSHPGITFVVGGALGLSQKILEKSQQKISFSAMTFPHDLFRVMLLEQVYRGFMIAGNREYHK